GYLWAIAWMIVTGGTRAAIVDGETETEPRPPLATVFALRRFWVCLIVGIGVNVCWHFYNQWFARYLSQELKIVGRDQQPIFIGFYLAADVGSLLAGGLIRMLIRRGATVERARQRMMTLLALGVFLSTSTAISLPMLGPKLAAFFAVAACSMGGFAIFFSLAQDVSPRHTAQVLGLCGCTAWIVISILNLFVGTLAAPGRYAMLFMVIGLVPAVAALAGWFWTPERKDSPE
ncbi:MAG: hypothetical protein ACRCZF_08500, partial [Gemmataceae bacterium]